MKKSIAYIVFTLALALALCGCGEDKTVVTPDVTVRPTATAAVSPIISPDVEDGIVGDTDGVIDDGKLDATPTPAATDDAIANAGDFATDKK